MVLWVRDSGCFLSIPPHTHTLTHIHTQQYLRTEAHRMIVRAVRKHLCPALRDLMEHGLARRSLSTIREEPGNSFASKVLLQPILGCFSSRQRRELMEDNGLDVVSEAPYGMNDEIMDDANSSGRRGSPYRSTHAWNVLMKLYQSKVGGSAMLPKAPS